MTSPKIAVVGTTRAGKSVFITVLAKHLETKRDGVRLAPRGGSPKNTYTQIEEWWNELQGGNWLPPTPPGTLIELNWDLAVNGKKIPLQMFDYAGETLTDLFSNKMRNAEGAAKEYFDQVRNAFESASVLLVLLNLESLIEQDVGRATETKGTLVTAMTAFLEKMKADKKDCRVCFIFTAYDRYKSVIEQRWGSVRDFLERVIPPLYSAVADENPNVEVLPVAAVGETDTRVEPHTGKATLYPKPGFRMRGFDQVVRWLVQATSDSKAELDAKAEELRQDQQNELFLQGLSQAWEFVQHSAKLEPVERFLADARQSFPYPQRPNVPELYSQLGSIINAASDLRSEILRKIQAERTKNTMKVFQIVAVVVALMMGGLFAMGAWDKEAKRQQAVVRAKEEEVKRQEAVARAIEEERLKQPRPELIPGETCSLNYSCNKAFGICFECRATAIVPVRNNGGAGNITVTVTIGRHSKSETWFFNQDQEARVPIILNNLPNHNMNLSLARHKLSAAK